MKFVKLILFTSVLVFAVHASAAEMKEVRVAAASDLQFAMVKLAEQYQAAHPGIKIASTFGSSGKFTTQIKQGAPFDLFFSADSTYPEELMKDGKVEGALFPYASGKIVLWVRNESKLDLKKGLAVLMGTEVKKVAIANPEHAPYGRAAEEALKKTGTLAKIESKIVKGENISQTAQFVESGAADIGIIALSLARSPQLMKEGRFEMIDAGLYTKLIQSGVVLKGANAKEAGAFRDFIMTAEAKKTLADFGLQAADK